MSEEISDAEYRRMQKLVLQRLHAKYDGMSEKQRNLPVIVVQDPVTLETVLLSPKDAIDEVEGLTDLGKHVILGIWKMMQQQQPV